MQYGAPLIAACNDSGCIHSHTCPQHFQPHYFALTGLTPLKFCTFYPQGKCANGNACRFVHSDKPTPASRKCAYFSSGKCRNGDACLYLHDASSQSATLPPTRPTTPYLIPLPDSLPSSAGGTPQRPPLNLISASAPIFQPCTFKTTGICARGDTCVVSHEATSPIYSPIPSIHSPLIQDATGWIPWETNQQPCDEQQPVPSIPDKPPIKASCRYHAQGRCFKGDKCRFIHGEDQNASDGRDLSDWTLPSESPQHDRSWAASSDAWNAKNVGADWGQTPEREAPDNSNASGWGPAESTDASGWASTADASGWGQDATTLADWGQAASTEPSGSNGADWLQSTDDWGVGAPDPPPLPSSKWTSDNPSAVREDFPAWSRPWPGYETKKRNCLAFGQGYCAKGDNCNFRHIQEEPSPRVPNREPTPEWTPTPPEVHTYPSIPPPVSIFNCKVDFAAGATTSGFMTSFEASTLILSNLPSGADSYISDLVSPYGSVTQTEFALLPGGKVEARVEFSNLSEAEDARYNLHGSFVNSPMEDETVTEQNPINARLDCTGILYGSVHSRPAQLKLAWNTASVSAWVFYRSVQHAKDESARLDGMLFKGYKIVAKYHSPRQHDRVAIRLDGLPANPQPTEDEMRVFCSTNGDKSKVTSVSFLPPNYKKPQDETIRGLLRNFGDVKSFDVIPTKPSDTKVIAFVHFFDGTVAKSVASELTGKKHDFLGKEAISVQEIAHVKYNCAHLPIEVIRPQLDELLTSSSVLFLEKSHTLHIFGSDAAQVTLLAKSAQVFLFGEDLNHWDTYFEWTSSDKALLQLNDTSAFHVRKDARRQVLRVWGDTDKAEKQIKRLLRKVTAKRHILPLLRTQIAALLRRAAQGGFQALFGGDTSKVILDVSGSALTVLGDEDLKLKVTNSLASLCETSDSRRGGCCVCTADEDLVQLSCSHRYCCNCVKETFRLVPTRGFSPIRCVAQTPDSDKPCTTAIPLSILSSHLPDGDLDSLRVAAFFAHARDQQEIRFCPTGCDVIFRIGMPDTTLTCSRCDLNICASCGTPAHPNLSCAEFNTKGDEQRRTEP